MQTNSYFLKHKTQRRDTKQRPPHKSKNKIEAKQSPFIFLTSINFIP